VLLPLQIVMELRYKYGFNFARFVNEAFLLTICYVSAFVLLKAIYGTDFIETDIWMLPLLIVGWYFSSRSTKTQESFDLKPIVAGLLRTANRIFVQFFLVILFFFTAHQTFNTIRFLVLYISLLCIVMPLEMLFHEKFMLFLREKGYNKRKILMVGAGKRATEFCNLINRNQYLGYEVVGFLEDSERQIHNCPYLGKTDKIEQLLSTQEADFDEVVVALPNSAHNKIKHIASIVTRQAVKLRIIPDYYELVNSEYNVSIFSGFPMITLRSEPLDNFNLGIIKRLFDLVFSSLVLISICSWLFPIIALCIKLDSKGPVFFVQERWGKKNRKIRCYKFRSMNVFNDAETTNGKYRQAEKNDVRITRVGGFLRKTSLDEFPQFLNVFKGEMSVVGPRPHPTPLNLESKQFIDNYTVRHLVKPGITGWAQVHGFRGETKDPSLMRARVEHDIWYIENWSLLLDLKIILLTFWKMFAGDKNAY
jgi:putative colanic acid biosynthesis UDP-glucose lipid carrier transferase